MQQVAQEQLRNDWFREFRPALGGMRHNSAEFVLLSEATQHLPDWEGFFNILAVRQ